MHEAATDSVIALLSKHGMITPENPGNRRKYSRQFDLAGRLTTQIRLFNGIAHPRRLQYRFFMLIYTEH